METPPTSKGISLSDFARYVRINTPTGQRAFSERELSEIHHLEYMQSKGYELKLMKCRGGNKLVFVKQQNT